MSLPQRRTIRWSLAALTAAGLGLGVPLLSASADSSDATLCTDAGNVWVHVEMDAVIDGGCATEFATGFEALTSAGFSFDAADGFINTINGEPAVKGAEDWWSYAHSDKDLAGWEFYMVGASDSQPVAGSIEAWRLMHTFDQDVSSLPETAIADLLADVEATPAPSVTPSATMTPSASVAPSPSAVPSPTSTTSTAPRPSLPNTGN